MKNIMRGISLKNQSRAPDLKKGAPIQALQKGL